MALAPLTDLTKSRLGLRVEEEMTWPFLEKSGSGGFVETMNLIKAGEQIGKLSFPDTAEVYVLLMFGSRCVLDPRAARFPSWAVARGRPPNLSKISISATECH